jgi:hypothetical protein
MVTHDPLYSINTPAGNLESMFHVDGSFEKMKCKPRKIRISVHILLG